MSPLNRQASNTARARQVADRQFALASENVDKHIKLVKWKRVWEPYVKGAGLGALGLTGGCVLWAGWGWVAFCICLLGLLRGLGFGMQWFTKMHEARVILLCQMGCLMWERKKTMQLDGRLRDYLGTTLEKAMYGESYVHY